VVAAGGRGDGEDEPDALAGGGEVDGGGGAAAGAAHRQARGEQQDEGDERGDDRRDGPRSRLEPRRAAALGNGPRLVASRERMSQARDGEGRRAAPAATDAVHPVRALGHVVVVRNGGPLDAKVQADKAKCDTTCVLILAGGVHRTIPDGATVLLAGMEIQNRLGLNVSDERRDGLTNRFGEQFRAYLVEMGVDPELLEIIKRKSAESRRTRLTPADWLRLKLVNGMKL